MNTIPKTYQTPACRVLQLNQAAVICASPEGILDPYMDNDLINEDFD